MKVDSSTNLLRSEKEFQVSILILSANKLLRVSVDKWTFIVIFCHLLSIIWGDYKKYKFTIVKIVVLLRTLVKVIILSMKMLRTLVEIVVLLMKILRSLVKMVS